MEASSRWFWVLLGRIVVYAICGALVCALTGALLVAMAGASVGLVLEIGPSIGVSMIGWGAIFGLILGGAGGASIGTIVFGVVGFLSASRRSYFPSKVIFTKVAVASGAATFGVMASFFILMAMVGAFRQVGFVQAVGDGLVFIMFIAPAVMMFGVVGGVIWGYKSDKAETQRAHKLLSFPCDNDGVAAR